MTISETAQQISQWPVDDRLELIDQIWDRIQSEGPAIAPSETDWKEILRRKAEYEADPSVAVTWEEIERYLDRNAK